jgi:hypothetical protein
MEMEKISQSIQVIAVVAGVVISVLSFNDAREAESVARGVEAEARRIDAEARRIEALAPFYQLRQERYVEISKVAAVLADSKLYSDKEVEQARRRFRALYIVELSMVESGEVSSSMKKLAATVAPELLQFTDSQSAAYRLSQALSESYTFDK